jgi:glycopeptide antibiotics resistance protein
MQSIEAIEGNMKFLTSKFMKATFTVLFILYLLFLTYLTLLDHFYGREFVHRSINIIPFKTINQFLTSSYNQNIVVTNILGNILAFMPMGFLLPLVFKKLDNFKKVLLFVLIGTVSIEVLQYITGAGATDIDDVILNAVGGILGYIIFKILIKITYKELKK